MADVFTKSDARAALAGRRLLFMGDSILRNLYQDLVHLLEAGTLTPNALLKKKGVQVVAGELPGDRLVPGTGEILPGRDYQEVSSCLLQGSDTIPRFASTRAPARRTSGPPSTSSAAASTSGRSTRWTRTWWPGSSTGGHSSFVRCKPSDLQVQERKGGPGPGDHTERSLGHQPLGTQVWPLVPTSPASNVPAFSGIENYKRNVRGLLEKVHSCFPASTQLVWLTSPPVSVDVWGGLMMEGMEFLKHSMRFNVMEGNLMVAHTVAQQGYDVVDLHYWMTHQIHKRMPDGIHWTQDAVRLQTNILLTHFCLSRDQPLPGRWLVVVRLFGLKPVSGAARGGTGRWRPPRGSQRPP